MAGTLGTGTLGTGALGTAGTGGVGTGEVGTGAVGTGGTGTGEVGPDDGVDPGAGWVDGGPPAEEPPAAAGADEDEDDPAGTGPVDGAVEGTPWSRDASPPVPPVSGTANDAVGAASTDGRGPGCRIACGLVSAATRSWPAWVVLSGPVPPGPATGDRSWLDGGSTGRPPGVPGPDIAMASTTATPTASVPPAVTVKRPLLGVVTGPAGSYPHPFGRTPRVPALFVPIHTLQGCRARSSESGGTPGARTTP